MSKTVKYNELNKYIIKCKRMANINDDETKYQSGDEEHNLAELKEELRFLFESRENVDIEEIGNYLKSEYRNFKSVEPIV